MRIFVDGIVFQNGYQRGIQRYFSELMSRIGKVAYVTVSLQYKAIVPPPQNCRVIGPALQRPPRRRDVVARFARCLASRRQRRECAEHDVFHSTYFTNPPSDRPARVVTVHDMICEQYQHMFPWADYEVPRRREMLLKAHRIIAISQATADELIAFYPTLAQRVRVIHHGAEHLCQQVASEKPTGLSIPNKPYVLFVGDRHTYKNFPVLLEATCHRLWPADLAVVVVGAPFTEAEALLLRRFGLERKVYNLGRLTDEELAMCYRGAVAFVFPSLCEGFGFPLLEAQSQMTPVACSNIAVFHEVAGRSAEYFEPRDSLSLIDALSRLRDERRSTELREAGMHNLRRFSWDRCADRTLSVYKEAAAARFSERIEPLASVDQPPVGISA